MSGPPKITLNELKKHMQLFLDFPHVEELIETQLQETVQEILLTKAQNGGRNPVDVLHDYINAGENWEMRLGIVVGFTQGSIEKLKRVLRPCVLAERGTRLKPTSAFSIVWSNGLSTPLRLMYIFPLSYRLVSLYLEIGLTFYRTRTTYKVLFVPNCKLNMRFG